MLENDLGIIFDDGKYSIDEINTVVTTIKDIIETNKDCKFSTFQVGHLYDLNGYVRTIVAVSVIDCYGTEKCIEKTF